MSSPKETQCYVWDLTVPVNKTHTKASMFELFNKHCKKWTFQEELGESGYAHWQCRVSLKKRAFAIWVKTHMPGHSSRTSSQNMGNDFYVMKPDTRIAGPWKDEASIEYIPTSWKRTPYTWQQQIIDSEPSDRHVNILVDFEGGLGKSFVYKAAIAQGIRCYKMDPTSGFKEITRDLCSKLTKANDKTPELVIVNFNRGFPAKSMACAMCGLETILDGEVQDDRYATKLWRFDAPAVWVFANREIPEKLMSMDRWKKWKVVDEKLVPA